MKEKEDKWITSLRERLKDHTEPLPDGLWEELAKELDAPPKVVPLWHNRRWQAAAAVAVVAVSSLTVWFWTSPVADRVEQMGKMASEQQPLVQPDVRPVISRMADTSGNGPRRQEHTASPSRLFVAQSLDVQASVPAARLVVEDTGETAECNLPIEGTDTVTATSTRSNSTQAARREDRRRMQQNSRAMRAAAKTKKGWEIGLGAGNTPYAASGSFDGLSDLNTRAAYSGNELVMEPELGSTPSFSQMLMNTVGKKVTTDTKHHLPVTIGASVKWHIDDGWAVESGVSYTMLSSEQRSGTEDSYWKKEYKLHYVGIPLKVHRKVWGNRTVTLYASAGGMVEKCVSGKQTLIDVIDGGTAGSSITKEKLTVKPLQWSVSAAVGAQVNLTKQVGLYAEPGVAYYFDDGSAVQTIRKEHPLNFNLSVGLRFNILK